MITTIQARNPQQAFQVCCDIIKAAGYTPQFNLSQTMGMAHVRECRVTDDYVYSPSKEVQPECYGHPFAEAWGHLIEGQWVFVYKGDRVTLDGGVIVKTNRKAVTA